MPASCTSHEASRRVAAMRYDVGLRQEAGLLSEVLEMPCCPGLKRLHWRDQSSSVGFRAAPLGCALPVPYTGGVLPRPPPRPATEAGRRPSMAGCTHTPCARDRLWRFPASGRRAKASSKSREPMYGNRCSFSTRAEFSPATLFSSRPRRQSGPAVEAANPSTEPLELSRSARCFPASSEEQRKNRAKARFFQIRLQVKPRRERLSPTGEPRRRALPRARPGSCPWPRG